MERNRTSGEARTRVRRQDRFRTLGRAVLVGLGAVLVLWLAVVILFTSTPWGSDRVRGFVESQLQDIVEGQVEIGGIRGSLRDGIVLRNLSVVDEAGRPFLAAEYVSFRYSVPALLRRRIVLTELHLQGARIVLDDPPGEAWNFERVFVTDPDAEPRTEPGWGDWIEIRDLRITGSEVVVRMEWEPDGDLLPSEREERFRQALAGELRERIVEVPGGYQSLMELRDIDALLSRVVVAHPESSDRSVELARLRLVALPFRPPAIEVLDVSGVVRLGEEALELQELRVELPNSSFRADGAVALDGDGGTLVLEADPVSLADLRFLHPPLPPEVEGEARAAIELTDDGFRVRVDEMAFEAGEGRLEGELEVELGDILRVDRTRVAFDRIPVQLIGDAMPALELPIHGELSGEVVATGEPVEVDLWVEFADAGGVTSRAVAQGSVDVSVDPDDLVFEGFRMSLEPLEMGLVRAFVPELHLEGTLEAEFVFDGPVAGPMHLDGWVSHRDAVAGLSRVHVAGSIEREPEFELSDVEVQLEPLQLDLARAQVEGLPPGSSLTGSIWLEGVPSRMLQVESDIALHDPEAGSSRFIVAGGLAVGGELALQDVAVTLAPFEIGSLRGMIPDLPVAGHLTGFAQFDGVPATGLDFQLDLAHEEGPDRSRVEAMGEIAMEGEGRIRTDVVLHELALAPVGAFVPQVDLEGSLTGAVHVEGSMEAFGVTAILALPEDADLEVLAALDLAGEELGYDLSLTLHDLDLSAFVTQIGRSTLIGGTLELEGRGVDPTSMQARLSADLADGGPTLPATLEVEAGVDDALATIRSFRWQAEASDIELGGSFGLSGDREGTLEYRVAFDSLGVISPLLPLDSRQVEPRPGVVQAALQDRESDLAEFLREAEVEFLATGRDPVLPEPVDTLGIVGIRTDALAGRLEASGWVGGNVERFDVEGSMGVEALIAWGHQVGHASLNYGVRGVGSPEMTASVELDAGDLMVLGFRYDSLLVAAEYLGQALDEEEPRHDLRSLLSVRQDEDVRIRADAAMEWTDADVRLRVGALDLAFEDAEYSLRTPASAHWSDVGLAVEGFRLESDLGGLLQIEGSLPAEEEGELDLLIDAFEIEHLMALLQEREGLRGRISLELPLRGTLAEPRFSGSASVTDVTLADHPIPDAHAGIIYADHELTAEVTIEEDGEMSASLEAVLPLDLSVVNAAEPRLLPGPIQIDARLHDLTLDGFDALTELVENVEGRVMGHVSVSGTFEDPVTEGMLEVVAPSVTVVPLGVRFVNIAGALHLEDDVVTVDSLVAYSQGPIRMSGQVDLTRPAEPAFDFVATARGARVIYTDLVRLRVDADLTVAGPFDGVVVEGEVRTLEGVIRPPETRELAAVGPLDLEDPATFERVDRLLVEARDALIPPSTLMEALTVELALHINRGMWVRSSELNLELFSPPDIGPLAIRMEGLSGREIVLDGTIAMDRGDYEFMGRRFRIARGSVTFTEGAELDPLVRLTAEHEVQLPGREAFDIRIVLDGPLSEFTTELESTAQPPLSETDLISLVVFGRGSGSLLQQTGSSLGGQGSSGGPLVGNMAAKATQQFATVGMQALLDELEAETARALGLDVLNIQPTDAPSEIFTGRAGDVLRGTEVEAGRYLTSRLFVSGQARPTFVHPGARLEYLTDRGYLWRATWRPQFLPAAPTLSEELPDRASVLGIFLLREWRF